jgi:amino acid adenylation domain-containing protein
MVEERMSSRASIDNDSSPELSYMPSTLVELLRWRALLAPDQLAYTFLVDGEAEAVSFTYGELDRQARAIAASIQSSATQGDRALLLYPPGLDFIAAFFGCLYAGVVAVPAYPPRLNRSMLRLQAIVADAQPTLALMTSTIMSRAKLSLAAAPEMTSLRWLATDGEADHAEDDWQEIATSRANLAFLQYTSGSTGTPKGVMLSHENLLHNASLVYHGVEHSSTDKYVSWLPTFHDMGFMAGVLQPLYGGFPVVLMSPESFLQQPIRWLQAISRHKATTSGGPNFAYDLCVRKINDEQRAALDLSSWSVAFNGAEPIRHATLERFAAAFASCGFRPETFYPCYGLAEATLIVSGGRKAAPPVIKRVLTKDIQHNRIVEDHTGLEDATSFVGCGAALLDQKIVIANPDRLTLSTPDEVGEIWVSGRSVAQGYWNNPVETERTFNAYLSDTGEGPFLRTGDLGVILDGELLVTGRLKDLLIIRGLNHYPQDIELTVERSHPALRPGCGAAFSVEIDDEERLVVIQEVDRRHSADLNIVIEEIRKAVVEQHELQAHAVVLVKSGSVLKTSSGKIQRHACRAAFLAEALDVLDMSVLDDSGPVRDEDTPSPSSLLALDEEQRKIQLERYLRGQLARVLRVNMSSVDSQQPLSTLGIDSLMSIELKNDIETHLGVNLSFTIFLEGASLAQLVAQIDSQLTAPSFAPAAILSPAQGASAEWPLSFGQQALWFLHELAPESTAYHIAAAVRLRTAVDVAALRRAFQALVDRHPSLRTTFTAPHGEPLQRVHEHMEICFDAEDSSSWSEAALHSRLTENAHRPFNLEQGPLLRVNLFTQSAQDHILLIVAHHIVVDFWSLSVLVNELGMLYSAEKAGATTRLAPLAVQYTDYVSWQAEMLSSPTGEKLWEYWQKQLAGELPVVNLPTDRPRPHVQTYRGASQSFKLSADLTRQLNTLSRNHGATLYMTLLAAFQLLLNRYTGQEDILVGSPTTGRTRSELAGLVGYFVNPVVLRTDLSGALTFKTLLSRVRQTVLAAFEHQEYPFPLLVERLQPERDPSRTPLFQILFILQKAHMLHEEGLSSFALGETGSRMELGELHLESMALEQRVAQFDLTLMLAEVGEELAASLQYNTDLFAEETMRRMAGHFEVLLESIVADPEQRLSQIALLTPAERHQLLIEWNDTAVQYPHEHYIHELFEQQAERTPDAIALIFDDQQVSYRELNERANQLAHHLRHLGVEPESLVAICVERSVEMVVGLLGILKAGGAYVPLDAAYPEERLRFMLEDAQVSVLLTQQHLMEKLPAHGAQVLCLDTDREEIAEHSTQNHSVEVASHNLAYIIYTSGSTGKPKGVMISHRALVNFLSSMRHRPGLSAQDVLLSVTTLSFDIAVLELYLPLLVGATLVLLRREETADGKHLSDRLRDSHATVMQATPSTWRMLVAAQWEGNAGLKLLSGGEALGRELADQMIERSNEVWNLYGPTETAIYSVMTKVEEGERAVTIGRPIGNTAIYILDAGGQVVPIGVAGELHIGGDGLARGYLNRAELTAERFIPDHLSREGGGRLYRTGDLTRYLADGEIEYLGRIDHQVKVRGHRIELGEIEATLATHAGVRQSVVVAREDTPGDNRLVAYVVSEGWEVMSASELRSYLREKLPDYMIPSFFVTLDELPLTPNGKIDRRSLPAPDHSRSEAEHGFVAARTPVEELLVAIWREVLHLPQVGIHDNFFHLGGHSLLATQVVSRIRDTFHVELPLRQAFELPSVGELAQVVQASMRAGEGVQTATIEPVSRDQALPLSYAQQRLWFIDQLESGTSSYNIPAAVRLSGVLDIDALERSLTEIVRRHEALRTRFETIDGEAVQVIDAASEVELRRVDLRGTTEAEREGEARRVVTEEAQRPFDLRAGPLLRALLVQVGDEEQVLVVVMHHIVSDGWSMGIFISELATLYSAYRSGEASPLTELAIQYADFAVWQREWLQGEVLEAQMRYWRERLSGRLPVLELPTDRPRPAVQSHKGAQQKFLLGEQLTAGLKELSQHEGVTLFMTLLTAFKSLLSRYTSQDEIVVGTPIANRNRAEVEGLIGFFVNTLVLRTDLSGDVSFRELLGRVRETALGAYAHQDVPFEQLVEELQPERDLSHTPLFQVMFQLENTPKDDLRLPGLALSRVEVDRGATHFDLSFDLVESIYGITVVAEYSSDLFNYETIAAMLRHFQTLLEGMLSDPEQRISELPLLTESEEHQLLVRWNDTAEDYPADKCLHELFEAQVARAPEGIATIFDGERLTYSELNRRANQLAHYLRALGVVPETPVGIMMGRSTEMVIGMLGTLKAGGAYVPLDPSDPKEHLAFTLEDAHISVLLTQERLTSDLPPHSARVVCVDTAWDEIARQSAANPVTEAVAENLAYIIYKSGSTGKPKGVAITHRSLVNHNLAVARHYALQASDRLLQFASISFDVAADELFPILLSGAAVVLRSEKVTGIDADILRLLEQEKVSVFNLPASIWHEWVRDLSLSRERLPSSLRLVIVGSEKVSLDALTTWQELDSAGAQLINAYGTSETTNTSTLYKPSSSAQEPGIGSSLPIGRPIANTQVYLLDSYLRPVPIGVPGELYIGGAGLARGYWRRAELTAERFIPNPFSDEAGSRLYRTGDLARYLADGEIEYLRRIDHQVKIRAFRIELGEIETALATHDRVQQCVVVAREDTPGVKRLVAYVVGEGVEVLALDGLRSYLEEKLPDYMIPSSFVLLDELPLTPNGKIDRRALPAPERSGLGLGDRFVAPRTKLERHLANMWRNILRTERVGIHDNFFELGGDSIRGAVFINKLQGDLDEVINVMPLFNAPTVATFAAYLDEHYKAAVTKNFGTESAGQIAELPGHINPSNSRVEPADSGTTSTGNKLMPISPLPRKSRKTKKLLAELEQLSDIEVRALLNKER